MAQSARRGDALSRERIVAAAVELLDRSGEAGLTFRALGARLRTGPGAIYWHVANKEELLVAATEAVLAEAVSGELPGEPAAAVRAIALGVFDGIDNHPWIGTQLARVAAQPATLRVFERLGQRVQALGVPEAARFDAVSALLNYILGVAVQNAVNARVQEPGTDRAAVLGAVSASLDPAEFPFVSSVAAQLRQHDDRAQFLAGVDLVLAGIAALR